MSSVRESEKTYESQKIDTTALKCGSFTHIGVLVDGNLVLHIHVNDSSVSVARSDSIFNHAKVEFSVSEKRTD